MRKTYVERRSYRFDAWRRRARRKRSRIRIEETGVTVRGTILVISIIITGGWGNTTIYRSEVFQVVPAHSSVKGRLGKRCSVGKIIYKLILNTKRRKDSTGFQYFLFAGICET